MWNFAGRIIILINLYLTGRAVKGLSVSLKIVIQQQSKLDKKNYSANLPNFGTQLTLSRSVGKVHSVIDVVVLQILLRRLGIEFVCTTYIVM